MANKIPQPTPAAANEAAASSSGQASAAAASPEPAAEPAPLGGAAPALKVAGCEGRPESASLLLQGSDYVQCAYKIAAAGLTHVGLSWAVTRVAFNL